MRKFIFHIILLLVFVPINVNAGENPNNRQTFEKIFANWTKAFNQKDIKNSCRLFARSVVADYQGVPTKNYESICDGFKKIFQLSNQRYQYSFKLHHIYHDGDLAAVRITWYLHFYEKGKLRSITQDEGIDILEKNSSGEWQIINYIGYASHIQKL